ncbi:LEA type 2 family protein [Halosimplex rubrum]|uniref:LEA type 2 family protein n=1 Tax=Halosimplex rubrum TaxID=869889 RepID=A0A7D5P440_9EURY|nr:LEA type 2 family protein [Halosimplex rubrum]QLH77062.1 LEA type 2 family protein [Halosimplex rubrum]
MSEDGPGGAGGGGSAGGTDPDDLSDAATVTDSELTTVARTRARLGALVSTWPRRIATGLGALVGLFVLLYLLGIVGAPAAGLVDRGDWGEVTDERTEVVTTVWVDNPNPVGVSLGDTVTADYDISLNDVLLAAGTKSNITVPRGNSTEQLRTDVLNDHLADWWVRYVRANETVTVDANATLRVNTPIPVTYDVRRNRTMLTESTPVIDSLSASANRTSGTYTRSVGASQASDSILEDAGLSEASTLTVGYEIERGWATWGNVTADRTTVVFHLRVHNPGDVPVPGSPEGIGVGIDLNDIPTFEADGGSLSARNTESPLLIQPNETREVAFAVTMDNDRVDEWFTSHVRNGERTTVESRVQLVLANPVTGDALRIPRDSTTVYDCSFRTAILIDDANTTSDCEPPSVPSGP